MDSLKTSFVSLGSSSYRSGKRKDLGYYVLFTWKHRKSKRAHLASRVSSGLARKPEGLACDEISRISENEGATSSNMKGAVSARITFETRDIGFKSAVEARRKLKEVSQPGFGIRGTFRILMTCNKISGGKSSNLIVVRDKSDERPTGHNGTVTP